MSKLFKTQEKRPPEGFVGNLDSPCHRENLFVGDILTVSGWVVSENSNILKIELSWHGSRSLNLTSAVTRKDVLEVFPKLRGAETSGFSAFVPITSQLNRNQAFSIYVYLDDGRKVECFRRSVDIKRNRIATFKRLIAFVFFVPKLFWSALITKRLSISPVQNFLKLRRQWDFFQINNLQRPIARRSAQDLYAQWLERNKISDRLAFAIRAEADQLINQGPKISVIVPVYNTPLEFLIELIASIKRQFYKNWELCIADDASTKPEVVELLKEEAKENSKIKVNFRNTNGHIVEASNTALSMASGEYVALLDHDDFLSDDALLHIAKNIVNEGSLDLLYTDEDKVDTLGNHFDPQFKGGWNPEMAITHNYIHHLTVIRRSLIETIGGFRNGYEGAQDLDLFLRIFEVSDPNKIKHVPYICYHWRVHPNSTASDGRQKKYIFESAYKAIEGAIDRRNLKAKPFLPRVAEENGLCLYQLKWDSKILSQQSITIVIPTKDQLDHLKACINSLIETVDPNYAKLLIINDQSEELETLKYLEYLQKEMIFDCEVLHPKNPYGQFNYAFLMNEGAKAVKTKYMLHLNNDVKAIEAGWLEDMAGWMSLKGVGVVGARLLYPNKRVQHAGVVIGPNGGLADHQFHNVDVNEVGYLALMHAARNVTAVTGACLLTDVKQFIKVGGFSEEEFGVEFNDVDFCIRLAERGLRCVYTPQATLTHVTSASRGHDFNPEEHKKFVKKYSGFVDPHYNRSLNIQDMSMSVDANNFGYGSFIDNLEIVFVSHNLDLGGAPISLYETAKFLINERGCKATLLSPRDGPLRKWYEELGVKVTIIRKMVNHEEATESEFETAVENVREKFSSRTDIVICNTLLSFWGVEAAERSAIPCFWNIHESIPLSTFLKGVRDNAISAFCCNAFTSAKSIIFQAESTRALFEEMNTCNNFVTISGGLPIDEIEVFKKKNNRKSLREKYGFPKGSVIISSIGATCERKGQHVFLEAIKLLQAEYLSNYNRNVEFIVVGALEGPYLDSLHHFIKTQKLDHVRILDHQENIYDQFMMADLFVCTSFMESFPVVLLLAMAFSLPIVTTNVDGIPEMIIDKQEGLHTRVGDAHSLAINIKNLLDDQVLSDKLGSKAESKAIRLFDNKKLLAKYFMLIQDAVSKVQ